MVIRGSAIRFSRLLGLQIHGAEISERIHLVKTMTDYAIYFVNFLYNNIFFSTSGSDYVITIWLVRSLLNDKQFYSNKYWSRYEICDKTGKLQPHKLAES